MYIYIYVYIYAYAHMYIYMSTTRACAPVQRCSSFLAMGAIANLSWVLREHRAVCRFRPPSCPFVEPAALLLASSLTCSLKKSVQIHASSWRGRRCRVAQASSDHPRWCGPHPVCLWFTLTHGRGSHPRQKSIFAANEMRGMNSSNVWQNLVFSSLLRTQSFKLKHVTQSLQWGRNIKFKTDKALTFQLVARGELDQN